MNYVLTNCLVRVENVKPSVTSRGSCRVNLYRDFGSDIKDGLDNQFQIVVTTVDFIFTIMPTGRQFLL